MQNLLDAPRVRRVATIGAVGGIAALYLAMVGLVEAFKDRNVITGVITLGAVMLLAVPLVAGYRAAIPPRGVTVDGTRSGPQRALDGLVAGLITGAMLGVLIFVGRAVDLRGVLISISPDLLDFLSFDQTPVVALLATALVGGAVGALGALLLISPPRIRGLITTGLLALILISLSEPFIRPRLEQLDYTAISDFLYQAHGLTVPAAIAAFVAGIVGSALWAPARARVRQTVEASPPERRRSIRNWTIVAALIGVLILPQVSGTFFAQVLVLIGLYLLLGLGLNIVVGYAGLLDLGYVAFFAVGAYLTALLTSPDSSLGIGLPFFVALPIVMLGAGATGLLIGAPVLRLRGDYLAIVTLGFGEIARILFESEALRPWLGGVQGILGIPNPFPARIDLDIGVAHLVASGPQVLYYPILAFCMLAAFAANRLANSRVGRAWNAMREDESVAEATGVSTVNYKLLAFSLGATTGCLSGALFAVQLQSVFPGSFDVLVSITVLAVIILGGMGSIPGVVVGAIVLIGLPQLLREFAEYRLLVYGGVLVAMMLLRPEGLIPNRSRQRELHDAMDDEEEAEPPQPELAAQRGSA
jgi:branched-chain amino acid transport system permease protein